MSPQLCFLAAFPLAFCSSREPLPLRAQSLSSSMFPFLVLSPFNHEEMFFSSPVPWAENSLWHSISLNSHTHFSPPSSSSPISKATINKLSCQGFQKHLGSLINVLWLSLCYWLIPLVLLFWCGPQSIDLRKYRFFFFFLKKKMSNCWLLLWFIFSPTVHFGLHESQCWEWFSAWKREISIHVVSTSVSALSDPWPCCIVQIQPQLCLCIWMAIH